MKIRNWQHAIDLTIRRHVIALISGYSYSYIREFYMQVARWPHGCPLCVYLNQKKDFSAECDFCLWQIYEGSVCSKSKLYNFNNNAESIHRLAIWKQLLPYLDTYPEMFKREA